MDCHILNNYKFQVIWDNDIRGNGVKTLVHINKGEMILEYKGDIITKQEEEERMARYTLAGHGAVGSYTYEYWYNGQWWW